MPELPEAERARQTLERVLHKQIAAVDDHDTYVCRPHQPGELNDALHQHTFTAAHRRGKFLWLDTDGGHGPTLGLHLGMAGRMLVDEPPDERNPQWDRFNVTFTDGSTLTLRDKRRLGRALLNPDFSHIGPDAQSLTEAQLAAAIGRSHQQIKARLLNQHVLSGVGNLLADQALWQARLDPRRLGDTLTAEELAALHAALRAAISQAIKKGGVHTGAFIPARKRGICPRDGTDLERATIGGRTTYWCPACQT